MSNTINADDGIISGVAGLKYSADTSGALVLQTNGTTAITISASQVVTFAGAVSLGALTTSGNLTFTGTGNRILGDFSNATVANRVMFQTSTTNSTTSVGVLPNGTATQTLLELYTNSDPANASRFNITAIATEVSLRSAQNGTGTFLPMTFYTGGSERMRLDTSGNLGIGTSSPTGIVQLTGSTWRKGVLETTGVTAKVYQGSDANGLNFTSNIYWNGGAWVQDDATKAAFAYIQHLGNSRMEFRVSPVGAFSAWTTAMIIDTSGNVGIGTGAPYAPLGVNSGFGTGLNTNTVGSSIGLVASGATQPILALRWTGVTQTGISGSNYVSQIVGDGANNNAIEFFTTTAKPLVFGTSATERMRIDSVGNVGIGTNNPTQKFVVSGSGIRSLVTDGTNSIAMGQWDGSTNRIEGGGRPIFITSYTTGVILGYGGSESMRIDTSNNVLMGTSSNVSSAPKLLVYGNSTGKFGAVINNANGSSGPAYLGFQGYDWVQGAIWHDRAAGYPLALATNPNTADLSVNGCVPRLVIDNPGNIYAGNTTSQNSATGIIYSKNTAKAYVYFSASGGTVSGVTGFNVSSVSRVATAVFQVNYTNALPSANYANLAATGNGTPGSGDSAGAIRMYQGTAAYGYFATGNSGFTAFQDNAYNSFIAYA